MKSISKFFTGVAYRLYPYRWLFVLGFFAPMLGWSTTSIALLAIVWVWSNAGLFIVLSYGPIKHFEGSIIWSDGWRPVAWIFLIPIILGAMAATGLIPYALLQNS